MMIVNAMTRKGHTVSTSYLDTVYNVRQFRARMRRAITAVKRLHKTQRFDAIAFRGSSGAAFAYPLSYELGIPLLHIKKKSADNGHSGSEPEGAYNIKRYIIVDDFVDSGATMAEIISGVEAAHDNLRYGRRKPKLVGIVLYSSCGESRRKFGKHTVPDECKIVCLRD